MDRAIFGIRLFTFATFSTANSPCWLTEMAERSAISWDKLSARAGTPWRKLDLLKADADIGLACANNAYFGPTIAAARARKFVRVVDWVKQHCVPAKSSTAKAVPAERIAFVHNSTMLHIARQQQSSRFRAPTSEGS